MEDLAAGDLNPHGNGVLIFLLLAAMRLVSPLPPVAVCAARAGGGCRVEFKGFM